MLCTFAMHIILGHTHMAYASIDHVTQQLMFKDAMNGGVCLL